MGRRVPSEREQVRGYPTIEELDQAAQGRPLFILRTDGHIGLANSAVPSQELGIDRDTPDRRPSAAFDHHPETGELTGLDARDGGSYVPRP